MIRHHQCPILFDKNNGWVLTDAFATEYYIVGDKNYKLIYAAFLSSDHERTIGNVLSFRGPPGIIGQQHSFFGHVVLKTWGDGQHSNCCAGFGDCWWRLNKLDFIKYFNHNPEGKIPPPAFIVAIIDSYRQEILKQIMITPNGVFILSDEAPA